MGIFYVRQYSKLRWLWHFFHATQPEIHFADDSGRGTCADPIGAFGQHDDAPAQRKILKKVMPTYPDLARRMRVHGIVKLEAIIAANGNVRTTKVTGGNPVLAQAAVDAVSKWKFGIAPEESTQLIELRFDPR